VLKSLSEPPPSPTFPVQASKVPTAEQAAAIIKFWLGECNQNHENCRLHQERISTSDMRPTRLLNVSNINHIWLHTRNLRTSHQMEYLTLSHCWPSDGKIFKLTKDNLESLKGRIPPDQLSQTFKDAIAITNAAGFRYLWIDSLCIVQDSPQDWATEANRMVHVYRNAALNIVACGLPGVTMFESRNPLRYYPCRIFVDNCSFYVEPSGTIVKETPAFKRGWIVQERLLSRRNIYFGMGSQMGEIAWECFEGNATETTPVTWKPHYEDLVKPTFIRDTQHKAIFERLLGALWRLQNDSAVERAEAHLNFSQMWTRVVSIYTQTKLTYLSDKLVSFAGIATMISQNVSSNYIAGMWMSTLPAGLLWFTGNRPGLGPPPERPAWRGAPSWSWASLDTEIDGGWPELLDCTTSQGLRNFHATLVDYETQPVTGRPAAFGEYESAKLRIASVLRPIREINTDHDCPENDGSREFGSNLIRKVLFLADVIIPTGTPLLFFTIFKGWGVNSYGMSPWYKEEGLVLMSHLDGYVRVGYMRIIFHEDEKNNILINMLWGDGKFQIVTLY
jgi:hypothetical protein